MNKERDFLENYVVKRCESRETNYSVDKVSKKPCVEHKVTYTYLSPDERDMRDRKNRLCNLLRMVLDESEGILTHKDTWVDFVCTPQGWSVWGSTHQDYHSRAGVDNEDVMLLHKKYRDINKVFWDKKYHANKTT